MRFEWDRAKSESNRLKHGIDFETARLVFEDPCCVNYIERITDAEERWLAIGCIEKVIIIVVAHTWRQEGSDEVIRLISARRATRHERNLYAQTIG